MAKESKCNHCGATIGRRDKRCPKCGKMILTREIKEDYSGVLKQQGRVELDDDWSEEVRISSVRKEKARVRCDSCGTLNLRNRKTCSNCGANL